MFKWIQLAFNVWGLFKPSRTTPRSVDMMREGLAFKTRKVAVGPKGVDVIAGDSLVDGSGYPHFVTDVKRGEFTVVEVA